MKMNFYNLNNFPVGHFYGPRYFDHRYTFVVNITTFSECMGVMLVDQPAIDKGPFVIWFRDIV